MQRSRKVVLPLTALLFAVTVLLDVSVHGEQQFAYLARSFLSGHTYFLERPGSWADTVPFQGRHYWPLGPLPAVVLMPLVLLSDRFGVLFQQGYLQPFLVAAALWLCFRIARRTGYSRDDSICLALGFVYATAFLGVAMWPWGWYFSHVLTVCLVLATIDEFIGRRRYWLLGVLCGLTLSARVTASFGIGWIALHTLLSDERRQAKAQALAMLLLPYLAAFALLLLYNDARFGDPFEQGYATQLIPPHAVKARDYGLFSPIHLPGNLYYLLLSAPAPVLRDGLSRVLRFPWVAANPWGMSLFVTSPCFLYLFGLRFRDRTSLLLLLTAGAIATPLLLYYGVGYRQFGYRYSLDFLPFLYYLLLRNYREQRGALTDGFRITILASAVANLYLFAGHYLFLPGR
jgi:hypothetical protein